MSSRAFRLDAFHRLALVPLADAFNHSAPNHVHLASDDFVCAECGSLEECEHDAEDGVARVVPGDSAALHWTAGGGAVEVEETCEMVAARDIEAGEEVLNTYGELGNAGLLAYYGFMLEANELDRISIDAADLELSDWRAQALAEWRRDRALVHAAAGLDLDGLVSVSERATHPPASTGSIGDHRLLWIDAEANLSWPLYLAVVGAALDSSSSPGAPKASDAEAITAAVIATAKQWHASSNAADSDPSSASEHSHPIDTAADDIRMVVRVAAQVCRLVERRTARQYRPELSGGELLELAGTATGEGNRTKQLAMDFLASERLVLECVAAKWGQLMEFCGGQLE